MIFPGTTTVKNFPATSLYGVDTLNEYKEFTRASAKAVGLPSAYYPSFNKNYPVKNWLARDRNTTQPGVFWTYETVAESDVLQLVLPLVYVKFITDPGLAGILNLPDEVSKYPMYMPAPTDAYENDGGNHLSMNPIFLSTEDQAKHYSNLMGNGVYTNYQPAPGTSGYEYEYPADEPRRYWQFIDNDGQIQTVGILLGEENGYGYGDGVGREGAPGKWVNANGQWTFEFDPMPAPVIPTGPIFQMPRRKLISTESIISVDAGMGIMIQNSALPVVKSIRR